MIFLDCKAFFPKKAREYKEKEKKENRLLKEAKSVNIRCCVNSLLCREEQYFQYFHHAR